MHAPQFKRETSTRGSRSSTSDLAADASPFSATTDDGDDAADFGDSGASGRTYSVRPQAWSWGLHGGRQCLACLMACRISWLTCVRDGAEPNACAMLSVYKATGLLTY